MLNYFLLGTYIVVLIISTLWVMRILESIGKACYQVFLPNSKQNNGKKGTTLPRLSEELEKLPMPWGWCTAERKTTNAPQVEIVSNDVMIPWGWPGNKTYIYKHEPIKYTQKTQVLTKYLAETLQFSSITIIIE